MESLTYLIIGFMVWTLLQIFVIRMSARLAYGKKGITWGKALIQWLLIIIISIAIWVVLIVAAILMGISMLG